MEEWNQDYQGEIIQFDDFNSLCDQLDQWLCTSIDEYYDNTGDDNDELF